MLIESPITLFLFAHQDDEMGVFGEIDRVVNSGGRAVCVYLTDGSARGVKPEVRNTESKTVLCKLGVRIDDMYFIGTNEAIPDGHLIAHLDRAKVAVDTVLENLSGVQRIVMHAWEGGHQDHDAVHLLGLAVAKKEGLLDRSYQFTLYRQRRASILPFALFQPLVTNGPVEQIEIPWRRLFCYLHLLTYYRSQKRTMFGLSPFVVLHYIAHGTQLLQPVDAMRVDSPPHHGRLLYEKRGGPNYKAFQEQTEEFRASKIRDSSV